MTKKRLFAGLLTLVMLVGLLPTGALAARADDGAASLEAPSGETVRLETPVWTDAEEPSQAELAEADLTSLTNIAVDAEITTSTTATGEWLDSVDPTDNLVDKNYTTNFRWANKGIKTYISEFSEEPSVTLSFGENRRVGGFKISVQKNDDEGTQRYYYHILGKAMGAAEYTELFSGTATKASDDFSKTHTLSDIAEYSDVKVAFTNQSDEIWPIFSEIEIFGEPKPLDLNEFENIAPTGTITHSTPTTGEYMSEIDPTANLVDQSYDTYFRWVHGGIPGYISTYGEPWVNVGFGENRKIAGFKISVQKNDGEADQRYYYHILGKAVGDTEYTELFSGTATKASNDFCKSYAFAYLQDLSDIKVAFTDQSGNYWPIFSEIEIFGTPQETPPDDPYEGLINVVGECKEVLANGSPTDPALLQDGSIGTWWELGKGTWPTHVDFALPGSLNVKRVEVDFERYDGRTFDLALAYAVNNVTTDYIPWAAKSGHAANDTYVYAPDAAQNMTHLRVSLLGTNGQAWPAIAEVRIYAVDETINFKDFSDITGHTTEASGAGYKEWDFGSNQQVVGFRVTIPEGVSAKVLGKAKRDTGWTTYFTALQTGDNALRFPAGMSTVRLESDNLASISEFKIFGSYTEPVTDSDSVAFEKPTHSNFSASSAYRANDGDKTTAWTADMYPVYLDVDLEANYNISQIEVFTPTNGYTQYTVYTSMDGRDFTLVPGADKSQNHASGTAEGDIFPLANTVEARYVRIYLEYYSESSKPVLNELRVIGQASGSALQTAPAVEIADFSSTEYAAAVTSNETIDAVKGIIARQVGAQYVDWFTLDLQPKAANGYDYFKLEDANGKIKVTGNNGVSLATGINHYLKYFCNVHISQVGNQVKMPASVVPINGTVHKETRFPVRYAYNYCTHSYTMSFWNAPEWQNELDWQALNGVNVVLDITGQEAVWREFLMSVGYTHQEAKDFLAGPGYYAWAYMGNLTGFGGPIHDSFLTERVELARKNQRFMRVLGMEPVLQAFSGMMPTDILTKDPSAQVIPQGEWISGFRRPDMLQTDTATYDTYAQKFYLAQKRIFGDVKYYATDPFHEGGDTGGMSPTTVSSALLDSLLDFDSDAVWIIQSWQGNPTSALLAGLRGGTNPTRTDRRDHALVLDLYAEKLENWKDDQSSYDYGEDTDGDGLVEFSDTPWVWCMLNNFGGRMGLHGHLDSLQKNIPAAANTTKHMAGIGMSPEGAQENPVLYDFLFETVWVDNAAENLPVIDLDQWLERYVTRRYGVRSENAYQAMLIMADTVYKSELNMAGQGSPESFVNARPALSIAAASTWGNGSIGYSKSELDKAAILLLRDYETLKNSDAYLYDVADVLKQVLSNAAIDLHGEMAAAYRAQDVEAFNAKSQAFLDLIDTVDEVLGTRSEFTFGKWTGGAEYMARNADDFTKRLYLRNAKALVTTWGSIQQSNGGLKDYSNRQWAGLTKDFYKGRWQKWIDAAKLNLSNNNAEPTLSAADWFAWEWEYARDTRSYSSTPNGKDLKVLGEAILNAYTAGEALFDTYDIDPASMTAKAGSQETSSEQAPAANVLDGNNATFWHTQYSAPVAADKKWIAFDLGSVRTIDGLRYLPRTANSQGRITQYKLYISSDDAAWSSDTGWTEVTPSGGGTWANNGDWKKVSFDAAQARYVKLLAIDNTQSSSDGNGTYYAAAEIRITAPDKIPVEGITLDKTAATLYWDSAEDATQPTLTLTATISPADATNKTVIWESENPDVLAVNNGVVTPVGLPRDGNPVRIFAISEADNTIEDVCDVTVLTRISGTVSIVGEATYGSTLTAVPNKVTPQLNARVPLTFQWKRGGADVDASPEAHGNTYTIGEADLGKEITVTLTASAPYEGTVPSSNSVTPVKADGPAAPTVTETNCTTNANNDGSITISDYTAGTVYEIKKDGGAWDDAAVSSNGVISNLTPGNYEVRVKTTNTHKEGASATATIIGHNIVTYHITIDSNLTGGAVTPSVTQAQEGAEVTLTVTPDTGWHLVDGSLKVNSTAVTGGTFTMPAENVTVTATFEKDTFTITHDLENITCTMDSHEVEYGSKPTITLTAHGCYHLPDTITITGADNTEFTGYKYENGVITFLTGITQNLTISGAAVRDTYLVDYTRLVHLTAEGPATVKAGEKLTVTLTPAASYYLPSEVYISVGNGVLHNFTYDPSTGVITIPENVITDKVTITAEGQTAPIIEPLTISADPAALSGGGQVSLSVIVPEAARDAVFEGINVVENVSTQLSVVCDDPAIQTRLTLKNQGQGLAKLSATLPNATKTYTFTATLVANEQAGYPEDTATCTVSVTKTGGSRPSTSTPTTPSETTSTQVKEDGTKVTTVTKPDGTVTETTEAPDGTLAVVETKKDGTVTETKTDPEGTKAEKVTTPEKDVTITVTDAEGEEIAKVELPAEIPAPETKFEDITQTAPWAEEAINKVAGLKLVNGIGGNKYDPATPMTRGSLATVLHRLSNGKTDYQSAFSDVAKDKFYAEGVAWAAKANVVKGISDDIFAPDQIITREQLAVMLARYAKLIGMDTKADAKALDQFADGGDTGAWAVDGVAWCVENGILKGKGQDGLDPAADVSRAEVAVMLDRFIALMK